MRFLFSVLANKNSEHLANQIEMTAIDEFNDKIKAAGQRVIAIGLAAPDTAFLFDFRNGSNIISHHPAIDSEMFMAGLWIIETEDEETAHKLAAEASKACNRLIEVRHIF